LTCPDLGEAFRRAIAVVPESTRRNDPFDNTNKRPTSGTTPAG
jgi:hypothetical protein